MKMNVTKAGVFSLAALLVGSPFVASAFDHETDNTVNSGHQGSDGTVWATITSTPYTNKAGLNIPSALCGIGFHQSPIAINLTAQTLTTNPVTHAGDSNKPAKIVEPQNLVIARYPQSHSSNEGGAVATDASNAYVFFNDGHVVKVDLSEGYRGELLVGHDAYPLVQFHFHTPSEHSIVTENYPAGRQYDGESHFVHQNTDGTLAVLAVFLEKDDAVKPNQALATILQNTPYTNSSPATPGHAGTTAFNTSPATVGLPLHPLELIPRSSTRVFTYAGGLTTPQCSEGVLWFVLSEPLKVPSSQIIGLQNFYSSNNRIIQNANNVSADGEASPLQRTVEIRHNFHAQPY